MRNSKRNAASLCFFFFLAILFAVPPAFSVELDTKGYLEQLQRKAAEKELHKSREWAVLLHYKEKILGGTESLIDDPKFFLAVDGKKNPRSELAATISVFFREDPLIDDHPACKFIARYEWLKGELQVDESKLPPFRCTKFEEEVEKIKPQKAVLIFPAAHMNSPASMFGHTLLRIDTVYKSKLVSYAVNYSANATDTNGMIYAFKGLFGFYNGYFSILPYYEKVKEYNNMDQRDMWEYELRLTPEEVIRMVRHIWELQEIYSYYYFFDENCSYNLLFLLEAARPGLQLTGGFEPSVIPVDTIKGAIGLGLVSGSRYRPSQATRIRNMGSLLSEREKEEALGAARREVSPEDILNSGLPEKKKELVLELATELVQYRYSKGKMPREEYLTDFLALLSARGTLGKAGEEPVPEPPSPEEGHGSRRAALGVGIKGDDLFQEIRLRPAYHDLLDPDEGFLTGSQIEFMDAALRYYPEKETLEIWRFDLLDIVSLSPRDEFFSPVSWKVSTGIRQKLMEGGDDAAVVYLNPGGGFAWRKEGIGLYYLLFETDINVAGELSRNYAFGAGGEAGLLSKPARNFKTYLRAKGIGYLIGDSHSEMEIEASGLYRISRNHSLGASAARRRSFGEYESEGLLTWNIYF